jgi:glycosyltransferase involved in cell wall biosynthesis
MERNCTEKNEKPEISVVIPTFRRPQLLKRAINSVLEQTYPHYQIYIYDDASQDETETIVAQFHDQRIHYFLHRENVGLNNNYNFALNRVDTPFFIFLSDDDLFMPSFLEEAVKGFEKHPEAGIFIGGLIYMDNNKRLMGTASNEWTTRSWYSSKEIIDAMVDGRFVSLINAMVFRKEVRDTIGTFNDRIWFDVEYITRTALQFSVILSPVSCIIYQLHSNISHKANIKEYWEMKMTVRDLILDSGHIEAKEKEQAAEAIQAELRKFIYGMTYQRFVSCRFSESLQGIDLLKKDYVLNMREKSIKWFSRLFIKTPAFVRLFVFFVKWFRVLMRFSHLTRIKRIMGQENFKAFKKTISNL